MRWQLAMAVLLCLFLGCPAQKAIVAPPKLTPEQERGQRLFSTNCMVCHETRSSTARQGPSLLGVYKKHSLPSGAPANDERVRESILYGRANMPAFESVLTDEQINDLIAYLHTL
jgi:mono/diheme cytochrome c family protein